jgi:butyryl-CoA dehydrogenase
LASIHTIENSVHPSIGGEACYHGEAVHVIPETKQAWDAFAGAGFLAAHYDFEDGGLILTAGKQEGSN